MEKTIAQFLNIKTFPFIIRDDNGREIYSEDSSGFWSKREFDSQGNRTYYENSDGVIKDRRTQILELTMDEIAAKLGIDVSQLKIKK